MGQNKALLEVAGTPLWKRQYELLADSGAFRRLVSVRAGDDWLPAEIPRVVDDGEKGPFGGLLSALEHTTSTHLIALAVDLPRMSPDWFARLRARCAAGRGAVGQNPRIGAFEPLAAVYPRELRTLAEEAARSGSYCLQSLIERAVAKEILHVEAISTADEPWFANWNTPDDVVGA